MDFDPNAPATKGDLRQLGAELKAELRAELASKAELAAVKAELKADIAELRTELRAELKGDMAALEVRLHDRITRSVAAEIGRVANVIMEHTAALFRGANDETRAVDERVRGTEARLEAHVADASVHRRPRR